jgi:thiol:disulfide interchange protein DsbD
MRKIAGICLWWILGWSLQLSAQNTADTTVAWNIAVQRSSDTTCVVTIQARLQKGLELFGLMEENKANGQLSSRIRLDSQSYQTKSIQLITGNASALQMPDDTAKYQVFSDSVAWQVLLSVPRNQEGWLTGAINWLGKKGDDFPSNEYTFRIALPSLNSSDETSGSWWQIFLICFLTGLVAVITPCVFPLVPVTVSFFLKKSETKQAGWRNALWYSISIVLIYTIPTLLLTLLFGDSILYRISVSPVSNLLFFIIFLLFAISFFGAFEISLPNSWANQADKRAGKGGIGGIFFMALTLVIVSFSCTGPLVGTLLGQTSSNGVGIAPVIGMFGFGLGLALPFSLLAFFPALLPALPKSGGWLNAVKVCFGFIELALALKFLSNVDLSYHWGILDRDVFLVLWIVIFGLMSLYLLGKIKLSHDSELKYLSVPRLFLAILSLSFTIYMIPGLWGAPLNALSGFIPPAVTQDFNLNNIQYQTSAPVPGANAAKPPVKYTDKLKVPFGLTAYFDLEEGLAAARQLKKPVMLDFTGHTCANCRKMEEQVWKQPEVLSRLKQDFVLISLYVDESTPLPPAEQFTDAEGNLITTVGEKNLAYEKSKFGINAQPLYMFLDAKGEPLSNIRYGYDPDVNRFLEHLEKVKQEFSRRSPE